MKPKIKKAHVYSVLFMRDDSGVTRFRVRAIWLKLMLLLFVLMTLAAGAGGYAAHYYWQRYEYHKAEAQGLAAERIENRRELERLANLENILRSNDPELLRTLVSNVPVNGDSTTDPASDPASDPGATPGAVAVAVNGSSTPPSGTAATTPAATPESPSTPSPTPANGQGQAAGTAPASQQGAAQSGVAQPQDGQGTPSGGDAAQPTASPPKPHPVKLSNIQVRSSGSRIHLSFDLGNQDSSQPLSGRVSLALVEGGGKITSIENADSESGLRFYQIMRYKPISASITLPQGVSMASVAAVRVSVETEGNPPFAQRLPMPVQ